MAGPGRPAARTPHLILLPPCSHALIPLNRLGLKHCRSESSNFNLDCLEKQQGARRDGIILSLSAVSICAAVSKEREAMKLPKSQS